MTNGETWRNKKRCHLCSLPWGEDYPWRKCDRHCGSAAEEMWAYRFWPWPLGMSVSSVSEIQKMMSLQVAHIRGSYYALWCLEVGDVWWKILIRVNKHLWYEWDDSIQGWCWFGTWDDANLNLQALDWTQKWCVLHLRHESKWLNVSQNPWIKFILHNNPSVLGSFQKLIFLASPGRRNFRRKTRICSFWSPRLGPETWLCRFLFPNENRLLTRVFHAPWGSWRSCGLALGLLPLDSWMGLYEWGTAMRNGWTFSERGFQVRWGRCGGACRELFWFFWPLWIWNKQLYIRGFKVRKFFKQQSTVIYFLQGKVQFVSCLTSLLMTRPLRSSSTQWTQMSHDEP